MITPEGVLLGIAVCGAVIGIVCSIIESLNWGDKVNTRLSELEYQSRFVIREIDKLQPKKKGK